MTYPHADRTTLFVHNYGTIKKAFKWQHTIVHRLAALLYTAEDRPADPEAIRRCMEMIKANTGAFSTFRGNASLTIAAYLSLSPDPQQRLNDTLAVYESLKQLKFRPSDYLVIAAHQIAAHAQGDLGTAVTRTKTFYNLMKAEHSFLTGQDDYIFAAMLGLSDLEPEPAIARMESYNEELRREFSSRNGLHTLTQMLVLGNAGTEASSGSRVIELSEAFRAKGLRLDRQQTMPALAMLALLPEDRSILADNVSAVFEELRARKGFGPWSINKHELILYAVALTVGGYVQDPGNSIVTGSVSSSVTALLIAQQAAMAGAAAAAAAAASSSSSH